MNQKEKCIRHDNTVCHESCSFGPGTTAAALSTYLPSIHSYGYAFITDFLPSTLSGSSSLCSNAQNRSMRFCQSRRALTTAWMQKVRRQEPEVERNRSPSREQRMEQLPRTTAAAPSSEEWYMEVPFTDLRMEILVRNAG